MVKYRDLTSIYPLKLHINCNYINIKDKPAKEIVYGGIILATIFFVSYLLVAKITKNLNKIIDKIKILYEVYEVE